MRNKFFLIILIVLALLDDFFAIIYPFDFTYHSLSFVPHFCFIALMLIVYSRNIVDRVLISALCGLLTDYFFMPTFPKYFVLYTGMGIVIGFFQRWMDEKEQYKAVAVFVSLFLLEWIPYIWNRLAGVTALKLKSWLLYHGMLTFSINLLMIILLIYIFNVYDRYKAIQNIRSQRVEKNRYRNMRLKRK